jgi:PPM family protein phosphatase
VQLSTSLLSDVGKVRGNNEDSVAEDRNLGLVVLADGMGGYQAGEVASRMAVAKVIEVMRSQHHLARDFETLCGLLKSAVEQANRAIFDSAHEHVQYQGMGTTIVACAASSDRFAVASVGDSRLYRYRGGELTQITRDHSLIQELVDHGHYSKEEALQLISKNIVTRALGVETRVQVDITTIDAKAGDVLLLCSDGLTDMLDDAGIKKILDRSRGNVAAASIQLVAEANTNGGRDNVSVILARVE